MHDKKFDPRKLAKLNNPERLKDIPPDFIGTKLADSTRTTLVEIGAGTAFFSIAMRNYFKPEMVYACDMSPVMIDWMTENILPSYPDILPVKTEESFVPLDDEIADLLFMINLHHELAEPAAIIKESYRLLKPGGEIFIVDWKKEEMAEGPPQTIRCVLEDVLDQLKLGGFNLVSSFTELPKHFLVTGRK
jgi:ubiquinone/menaquinone biosynthesis C-methylase UbiE